MKKKILIFTGNFLPTIGGAELVIYNLAQELSHRNYDVVVVCGGSKKDTITVKKKYNVNFTIVRYPYNFRLSGFLKLNTIISYFYLLYFVIFKKYKMVHAHWAFHPGYTCSLLKKITQFDYILTLHGGNDFQQSDTYTPEKYFLENRHRAIKGVVNATAITAISQSMRSDILSTPRVKEENIFLIHNGINSNLFKELIQHKRDNSLSLISVGRNDPVKNFPYLIEVFYNLQKIISPDLWQKLHLTIIGTDIPRLQSVVQSYDLIGKVTLIDQLHQKDIVKHLQKSYIYLQTSLVEGFGMGIVEAMACGLPPVVTDVPGLRDLVQDDFGRKASVNNPLDMAQHLKVLLENKQLYNNLKKEALTQAKLFHWSTIVDQYEKVYQKIEK